MFAQTLWSAKGNMHHNLAQKLCQVLGKLLQLLRDFVPRPPTWALPLDPTGGLPSTDPMHVSSSCAPYFEPCPHLINPGVAPVNTWQQ